MPWKYFCDGWMDGWMDGRTDGWMDGRMDGWTDGRMDVLLNKRHILMCLAKKDNQIVTNHDITNTTRQ